MNLFSSHAHDVMKPVAAGQFYPGGARELSSEVSRYLAEADIEPSSKKVLAVLTPHAGYVFSGPVAGFSFKHVQNQHPDTVLFLALAHRGVEGAGVFSGHSFETPLGRVSVDLELTAALLEESGPLAAEWDAYLNEHSIEVNLPFVQTVFPGAQTAAILITHTEPGLCRSVGQCVARVLRKQAGKNVLIVVSSDMSHYPPYEVANRVDREMLASLETLDSQTIYADYQRLNWDPAHNVKCIMCGSAAMLAAVEAARGLGAPEARILAYRNSGDSPMGKHDKVVGYGALAIYAPAGSAAVKEGEAKIEFHEEFYFTPEERKILLDIARRGIWTFLNHQKYQPAVTDPRLLIKAGLFVTLKNQGELRGCLGRFDPDSQPLYRLVGEMAVQSASHDIRFRSVTLDELPMVDIQISVLSPRRSVKDIREIQIGRHGLQVQGRSRSGSFRAGTLLPQVATEQGWDVSTFLDATCVKAGLEAQAWKDPQIEIFLYEAIVFGDRDFGPPPYMVSAE
ncbi:MAG: AmmeMemoRadiSam system protein B [bacterium]